MTVSPTGYTDWLRQSPASTTTILNGNMIGVTGVQNFGPFPVAGYPAIGFRMSAGTNNWEIAFLYTNDAAGTLNLGGHIISVNEGGVGQFSIPVRGAFLSIRATPSAAVSTGVLVVYSVPDVGKDQALGANTNTLISVDGILVGPGVTRTDDIPSCWPGPATVVAHMEGAAAWRIRVYSRDIFGNLNLLDYISNGDPIGPHTLHLPPCALRITSFNNDGVNRALFLSITSKPFTMD